MVHVTRVENGSSSSWEWMLILGPIRGMGKLIGSILVMSPLLQQQDKWPCWAAGTTEPKWRCMRPTEKKIAVLADNFVNVQDFPIAFLLFHASVLCLNYNMSSSSQSCGINLWWTCEPSHLFFPCSEQAWVLHPTGGVFCGLCPYSILGLLTSDPLLCSGLEMSTDVTRNSAGLKRNLSP